METIIQPKKIRESFQILLVGNNPIEMTTILNTLRQIRGAQIIPEIAFDIKTIAERLSSFTPHFILIDDNLGKHELKQAVDSFSKNFKTKNIPITVLKNSNYDESFSSSKILDYLLKQNLSPELLYNTLKNAFKLRRTQLFLCEAYKKRKVIF